MNLTTGYRKKRDVTKTRSFFNPSLPSSPSLSRAAYYSVLIYKALNVILQVQVKEKNRDEEKKEEKKKKRKKKKKRHLEMDKERENVPNMRK